jgi:dihydrofolate reductase
MSKYEGRLAGTPSGNLDPPIYATDARRGTLVDDVRFAVVPVIVGGGLRLFPDGLPHSRWSLVGTATLAHGAVGLHYRRA